MVKFVYAFEEGSKEMKSELGGKGANLAEMIKIGLPVPDGFVLSTKACMNYYKNNKKITENLSSDIEKYLSDLETKTGKTLGGKRPLLVSVRSGAAVSMPGMMDTILNLGLNDQTVEILATESEPVFAWDAYRRLIQMFGDVVLGIEKYKFDKIYQKYKEKTIENLKTVVKAFKNIIKKESMIDFPEDPRTQLYMAIEAVFNSWFNHRAIVYRKLHKIPDDLGTAVTIQSMVFGNTGAFSGTGVAFTRHPSTGKKQLFGEYLLNAQGEDVVAGIRTPYPIETLKESLPLVYEQFVHVAHILEEHYKDMQDIEFTIEKKKLYLLQTRIGKRTAEASIQIAVDLVEEGVITKEEALMRIEPEQIDQLLHPRFSDDGCRKANLLTKGLPASPGAASGRIYFDADEVKKAVLNGEQALLVRTETSPEDIEGMIHAQGILTSRGGMTSHAAVVARGMGKCCIAGCHDVTISDDQMSIGEQVFKKGDFISLDGSTGCVYQGIVEKSDSVLSPAFDQIMLWADEFRKLEIRTNADTVHDATIALKFGAEGIGLCRTEHMFFAPERILNMRKMILAISEDERKEALKTLLTYQRQDFFQLFELMNGLPITIRLLDPPLHEFLPQNQEEVIELSQALNQPEDRIFNRIQTLKEVNPMLGHRGCRLGITYPEIYDMQVKAIVHGLCDLRDKGGSSKVEIMLPLIGFDKELEFLKNRVDWVAKEVLKERGHVFDFSIGTMIEVPRAALTADELVNHVDFFSFGTNDLTQMTLGFSRDDVSKFIHDYMNKKIVDSDPFQSIDQTGVGFLMKIAIEKAQKIKPEIKLGICGEHGGEPKSIEFCHRIGLNYVSCSPFRVLTAKLSAAKAAILDKIDH